MRGHSEVIKVVEINRAPEFSALWSLLCHKLVTGEMEGVGRRKKNAHPNARDPIGDLSSTNNVL